MNIRLRPERTSRRSGWVAAALLSLLMYIMPPFFHGRPVVIQLLYDCAGADPFAEEARDLLNDVPGGFEWALLPAVVALVLVIQFGVALTVRRFLFAQRWWRLIVGVFGSLLIAPSIVTAATATFVPIFFRLADPLLVRSRRQLPERASWKTECDIDNYEIEPFIDTPPDDLLQRSREVWVRQRNNKQITTLRMTGCIIAETKLSAREVFEIDFYGGVGGKAIYVHDDGDRDRNFERWWYVSSPFATPQPINAPANADAKRPALSSNGEWVGWINESGLQHHPVVILRSLKSSETITIDSQELQTERLWLLGINADAKTVLVARKGYEEAVLLDFAGNLLFGPVTLGPSKESVVQRVLLRAGGWVGWYGEPTRNTVEWSLPSGNRKYAVQSGTQINSVDASPDGRLVAIGTDGDFFGSRIESMALVLDAATGAEIFRKYFPRRCWVKVAFLGNEFLAYSSSPHNFAVGGAEFKILRVPK